MHEGGSHPHGEQGAQADHDRPSHAEHYIDHPLDGASGRLFQPAVENNVGLNVPARPQQQVRQVQLLSSWVWFTELSSDFDGVRSLSARHSAGESGVRLICHGGFERAGMSVEQSE